MTARGGADAGAAQRNQWTVSLRDGWVVSIGVRFGFTIGVIGAATIFAAAIRVVEWMERLI